MMQRLHDADMRNTLRVAGMAVSQGVSGTVVAPLAQLPRHVFITAILEDVAICKPAIRTPAGWRIPTDDNHRIRAMLAPNHTAEHYTYHVLTADQPCEKALACTLERDGQGNVMVIPGYRFRLVEPPDPADCAECS